MAMAVCPACLSRQANLFTVRTCLIVDTGKSVLTFFMQRGRLITLLLIRPITALRVLSRITFCPSGVEPKGGGTTAYAWFVWDKEAPRRTELKWFKPGYKPAKAPRRDS